VDIAGALELWVENGKHGDATKMPGANDFIEASSTEVEKKNKR